MNILFLAQDVTPSARSGDAVHLRELVINLNALGHSVIVIGRDLEGVSEIDYSNYQKVLDGISNDTLKFVLLKTRFKLSFPPMKLLHTLVEAMKVLGNNRIDLIYSRSFNCWLEVFLSQLSGVPLVLEINGLEQDEAELMGKRLPSPVPKRLRTAANVFLFRFPSGIITVTDMLRKILVNEYSISQEIISVVPNGANTELFKPLDQLESKMKLGLDLNKRYICYMGSLEPWQGIEYLIMSFPGILGTINSATLLIVGGGLLRKKLEVLSGELGIRDKIVFTGSVPYTEVPTYINASDVCVAPFTHTRNEKIGLSALKIYEYLACGKSIVASDIKGVGDLLTETNTGIAVKPEDVNELAKAIIELLSNEKLRTEMGKRGVKVVMERHNWKLATDSVYDILKKACERYRQRDSH